MEDKRYLTPLEIREKCIQAGIKKCELSRQKTILLAIMAGMFIAFGAASANMAVHNLPATMTGIKKLISGAIFPTGLIIIVLAGGELFTGNNLIIVAALEKKVKWKALINNWINVYLGNFIGAILISWMLYESGFFNTSQGLLGNLHVSIAAEKVGQTFIQLFIKGVLCNILVSVAVWMSYSSSGVIDKIFAMWFPVMVFIVGGYEHSIANMYYIPAGMLAAGSSAASNGLTLTAFLVNNLIPVTLGNIVGGSLVVGALYWYIYSPTEQTSLKLSAAKLKVHLGLHRSD